MTPNNPSKTTYLPCEFINAVGTAQDGVQKDTFNVLPGERPGESTVGGGGQFPGLIVVEILH